MSSLETSINNFIRNLENNNDINNICLTEKQYIDNKYLTIGSRKSTYSTYRKHIKNSDLDDVVKYQSLKFFKLTKNETNTAANGTVKYLEIPNSPPAAAIPANSAVIVPIFANTKAPALNIPERAPYFWRTKPIRP